MDNLRYILITPARNEEPYIEKTIRSVISQTVLPVKWVIVSDGSTDHTDEIAQTYVLKYPWIEFIRMPEHEDRQFAAKVDAFNAGYKKVKGTQYQVVGNLDADVSFENNYFEFLLQQFFILAARRFGEGGLRAPGFECGTAILDACGVFTVIDACQNLSGADTFAFAYVDGDDFAGDLGAYHALLDGAQCAVGIERLADVTAARSNDIACGEFDCRAGCRCFRRRSVLGGGRSGCCRCARGRSRSRFVRLLAGDCDKAGHACNGGDPPRGYPLTMLTIQPHGIHGSQLLQPHSFCCRSLRRLFWLKSPPEAGFGVLRVFPVFQRFGVADHAAWAGIDVLWLMMRFMAST